MRSKLQRLHKLFIGSLLLALFIIYSLSFSKEAKAGSSDFIIEKGTLQEYKGSDKIVTVPNNVTIIGKNAFRSNEVITEVILPEGLNRIEDQAFRDCTELRSIQIPDSVDYIGFELFYNCSSLENVILPARISAIHNSSFEKCSSLTIIKIPENVEFIGTYAFKDCTNLKTIEIPKSVNFIATNCFNNTEWLNNNHDEYVIVNHILIKYQGEASKITIPNGVISIGNEVFLNNTKIISVTIPNSLERIEYFAFNGCTGITEIHIPDSVTKIEMGAFKDCINLKSVTVSKNCKEFGSLIFEGTKFYTNYEGDFFQFNGILLSYKGSSPNVRIPDYISEINWQAFFKNYTITSLSFPKTITHLYNKVVYQCPNLKSIYIPDSVDFITNEAFTECHSELKILGSENSYAESYAANYGLTFVKISINKTKVNLYNGNPPGTVKLSIIGMKDGLTWSSDNTKVASVSETGKVTAVGVGKAVISADINGIILTCDITVKEPYLSYTVLKLKKGNSFTLKLYGYSSDITWKSSNSSIVKVASNGKVSAVKTGKAVITATVNGKKYQCTITVH